MRIHESILDAPAFTHSWLRLSSFPIGDATVPQRERLRALAGVEVHFPEALMDDRGFVKDFVAESPDPCYLYAADAQSHLASRVLTHKGLFSRTGAIRAGEFCEEEVLLDHGYRHFVGITKVTPANFNECFKWFADGERSFMLLSQVRERLSCDFARHVLLAHGPRLPGMTYVNYLSLILDLCSAGDQVCRMGGYSGDGDSDFQIFLRKSDLDIVTRRVRKLLQREEI